MEASDRAPTRGKIDGPATLTRTSVTVGMNLDRALSRLSALDVVDALAVYGPRAGPIREAAADYDILVLATERPFTITHLCTTIDRRTADVLFMDVATYDAVLDGSRRVPAATADARFMHKMRNAWIVSDRSGRLARGRAAASDGRPRFRAPSFSGQYMLWFSQNFRLAYVKRLTQSIEPSYMTAADVLVQSSVEPTLRAYFELRQLPWQGEKDAVRYLAEHDPEYLSLLRACLAAAERQRKLSFYEQLVNRTLQPFGETWQLDTSAVCLGAPIEDAAQVHSALEFWDSIFR